MATPAIPVCLPASDCLQLAILECHHYSRTCVEYYCCWVLLNFQHPTVRPQNCYAPIIVDDIFTNGTQSWASKSRWRLRFTRGARRCSINTFLVLNIGLSTSCYGVYGCSDPSQATALPRSDKHWQSRSVRPPIVAKGSLTLLLASPSACCIMFAGLYLGRAYCPH